MSIPHRGVTSESTYFVTGNVLGKRSLFQVEKIALLFIDIMVDYQSQGKYLLHDFVVMPDHIHVILTPCGITLERAMQLIKGGFSFQFNKNLKTKREIWQPSFMDRRIRDAAEYERFREYIAQNPVKTRLVSAPHEYRYGSANGMFHLDPVPQRLKPPSPPALPQA